jgi:uncharacterized membrane protein YfcA
MIGFHLIVCAVAILAGGIASMSGFGIGSLLTPLLGSHVGTKVAVAVVSVPHCIATVARFWMLRKKVDRKLLWSFGLMSAAGGLAGALLHTRLKSPALTLIFGCLLILSGLMGLFGRNVRFKGWVAWTGGAVSGALGGLVGNQGGIRSAAMLGFDVSKEAFVATATAVGLIVDGARIPVYVATQGHEILDNWPFVATATLGTLIGTVVGQRILRHVPEPVYRRSVSALVVTLGVYMLLHSHSNS